MSNLVVLPTSEDPPEPGAKTLLSVPVTASWLPELTPSDARRLAVALLEEAEEVAPAPPDVGVLPYGWRRISLVVPSLDMAPVIDLVETLRGQGMGDRRIAAELNARGLKTQTGGDWHHVAVRRLSRAWPGEARRRWTVPTVHRLL